MAPFILQMKDYINKYEFILHIHTKKSSFDDKGHRNNWRKYLLDILLGSVNNIHFIFNDFLKNEKLGIIYPETFANVMHQMNWGTDRLQGKNNVVDYLKSIGINLNNIINQNEKPVFPSGNMFWARTEAIKKAFNDNISQNNFPEEAGQLDMTLAHAIERSWVYIAHDAGFSFKQIIQRNKISNRS